ncbi:endolytic transglycosylase MltG [Candidatus Parcubacteria bacterium]|nr:MAG: endolytic transglycosylase MltG [Candidatus Parcubacteria bacterium]
MIKIIKIFFVLAFIVGFWFLFTLTSSNDSEEAKTFVIKSGQGVNEISNNLDEADIIKSKFVFETWLWLKKSEDKMQAGVYDVPGDISIRRLANMFMIGSESSQQAITLLEGWSRPFMAEAVAKAGYSEEEFLEITSKKSDWQSNYDFLEDAPDNASLEGYIFPDTYFVDDSTTLEIFVGKCLNNFDKKLTDELRQEIEKQGKSIFEVVTLASIIEREVPVSTDKKMIADVFLKRIDAGIGLQSDATINFITGKKDPTPSLDDLQVDSPYNTYKYRGLPPGPIASPGIDSIEAVLYPTSNDYYYFLTTPEGDVIYSVDHDEHVANKQKYLK